MPQFTVLMANHNKGAYIENAIVSVLAQTFSDWELVIVDDASTDNSLQRVRKYLSDPRVHLYAKDRNEGYTRSLIYGLGKASSEVVGILDSDDALAPQAIERVHAVYRKRPDVGVVLSQTVVCDPDLQPLYVTTSTKEDLNSPLIHMKGGTNFRTFRLSSYAQTSGLDPDVSYAEDWDLVFKLEEVSASFRIDEPLYKARQLASSQSHSAKRYLISHAALADSLYRSYRRRLGTAKPNLPLETLLAWLIAGVQYSREIGARGEAMRFSLRAIRTNPFEPACYRSLWAAISMNLGTSTREGSSADRRCLPLATKAFQSNTGCFDLDRVKVTPSRDEKGHCLFGGDYIILEKGAYRAIFEMKLTSAIADRNLVHVRLDIYENLRRQQVLAEKDIRVSDVVRNRCTVQFEAEVGDRVEFRAYWHGCSSLTISGVVLEHIAD